LVTKGIKMSNLHNLQWYEIPCSWQVYGTVEVAANSLDAAIEKVEDEGFPLPSRSSYVDGSFEVDRDIAEDINSA
tara:strand:+ start:93 stop:317 length:225 start_codon:yes stop_codon:yes gene_type:complete